MNHVEVEGVVAKVPLPMVTKSPEGASPKAYCRFTLRVSHVYQTDWGSKERTVELSVIAWGSLSEAIVNGGEFKIGKRARIEGCIVVRDARGDEPGPKVWELRASTVKVLSTEEPE